SRSMVGWNQPSWSRCTAGPRIPAWGSPSGGRGPARTPGSAPSPGAGGGGRGDEGEELHDTALREAEEEIGLARGPVEIVGALTPIGTFATNYKVHPFVGLIQEGPRFEPNPAE